MPWSGAGPGGHEAQGPAGGVHPRAGVRHRARPLHVRLHGADAGRDLQAGAKRRSYGASLLLAYGVGHCAVIVAAGTSTELVQRYLNWNEQSKG